MDKDQINEKGKELAGELDNGNVDKFYEEVNKLRQDMSKGNISRQDWNSIVKATDSFDRKGVKDDIQLVGDEKSGYLEFGGPVYKY